MLLNEYEGKKLFQQFGISTPAGVIVTASAELEQAASTMPFPVAVKAQVPTGKRGKSGGILFANSTTQLTAAFESLIGNSVNGHPVDALLVEEKADIRAERYIGLTVSMNEIWLMIGRDGGVEIEANAALDPASLARIALKRSVGDMSVEIESVFERFEFPEALRGNYFAICGKLEALLRQTDALTAEINPLVETVDGRLVALDARVDIDDAAIPRQPEIQKLLRLEPSEHGFGKAQKISQLQLFDNDGAVGLVGLGGGMAMTVSDWLASERHFVAGAIDMDCSLSAGDAEATLSKVLREFDADGRIKVVLVNMISSGNRIDRIAAQLLPALKARQADSSKPIVVHLQGNGGADATSLLRDAGIDNRQGLRDALNSTLAHLRA